jgi:hypothetical protein
VLIGKEHERIASLNPVTVCTHFFPIRDSYLYKKLNDG